MNPRKYIKTEAEIQYQYKIDDQETYSKLKHLVNDIFRSIQGSVSCEFGGFAEIGLTDQMVKDLIKEVVEQHPVNLIK